MKRLLLVALACVLLIAAAPRGSLNGWTVSGGVQVVQKGGPGSSYGRFHAEGSGTLSQTVFLPAGTYVLAFWCNGNTVVSIAGPEWSDTQACDPVKFWPSYAFSKQNMPAGNVTVTIQMANGGVDEVCLYPIDPVSGGSCPPSLLQNYSFDNR